MKTVMVLSGGTGTAWGICGALEKVSQGNLNLVVCDINPPQLVHTSVLANEYVVVPPIKDEYYYKSILYLLDQHKVDILIPLIDFDLQLFSRDNCDLIKRGIFSTAPEKKTFVALSDKRNLWKTAQDLGVPTPKLYTIDDICVENDYFIKPVVGFGSRGAKRVSGEEIIAYDCKEYIIQELCQPEEITVDISSVFGVTRSVCRERVETKAGVCTKARVFYDAQIASYIERISEHLKLPECCCAQFMKGNSGEWLLTDFNLRLGAGSALSAAVGFDIAFCAAASWLETEIVLPVIPEEEHYVVRHYSEIVTK